MTPTGPLVGRKRGMRTEYLVPALRLCCQELDLAPARELSLFDGDRAADGALALGRVRLLLSERYGNSSLRRLADIPLSRGRVQFLLPRLGIQYQSSSFLETDDHSPAGPEGLPPASPDTDTPAVNSQTFQRCGLFPTKGTTALAKCPGVSWRAP